MICCFPGENRLEIYWNQEFRIKKLLTLVERVGDRAGS